MRFVHEKSQGGVETGVFYCKSRGNADSIAESDFIWIFIHSFVIIFLT